MKHTGLCTLRHRGDDVPSGSVGACPEFLVGRAPEPPSSVGEARVGVPGVVGSTVPGSFEPEMAPDTAMKSSACVRGSESDPEFAVVGAPERPLSVDGVRVGASWSVGGGAPGSFEPKMAPGAAMKSSACARAPGSDLEFVVGRAPERPLSVDGVGVLGSIGGEAPGSFELEMAPGAAPRSSARA